MNTQLLNKIHRNMDMEKDFCRDILELINDCEARGLLDSVDSTELDLLRKHCEEIIKVAEIAQKLEGILEPIYEEEDKKLAEEAKTAEEEKPKKKRKAKKITEEPEAKTESEIRTEPNAESIEVREGTEHTDTAESQDDDDDDDMSFLE